MKLFFRKIFGAYSEGNLLHYAGVRIFNPILKKYGQPGLSDLHKIGSPGLFRDSGQFIAALFGNTEESAIIEYRHEFKQLMKDVFSRSEFKLINFPDFFNLGENSTELLYLITRIKKPNTILETGIANGLSTVVVLNALSMNKKGKLYSIDVRNDVGILLTNDERKSFNPIILSPHSLKKDYISALKKISAVDIFMHDSNHSYEWQLFEYEKSYAILQDGGLLLSDDIDCSFAFSHFINSHDELRCLKLIDESKVFAVASRIC